MIETRRSKTYKATVGCGHIYSTVTFNEDGSIHKFYIHRNSKFKCSLVMREHLAKQSTFQSRRDIKQLIKDLTTDETSHCDMYNIGVKSAIKKGEIGGYSCGDAIARLVIRILKDRDEENKNKDNEKVKEEVHS